MIEIEINNAKRKVVTDALQMSVGEIVNMYEDREIIIDPEFQRLFRWDISRKSRFIESILLGIPLPSIFVFEKEDGTWELIDGLQRISTLLEFMGKLKIDNSTTENPSILEATKYIPSLHNVVWEKNTKIEGASINDQRNLDKNHQLAIRRSRIGVQILKRPSDSQTKYDLFQRLNAGGMTANAQELRNCIMLMVNSRYFRAIKAAAETNDFEEVIAITDDQIERQKHIEQAVRFLVHASIPYDGKLDVEEYIDDGAIKLATAAKEAEDTSLLTQTFELLNSAAGRNALRRFENGQHTGKIGLVGLEGIASGVARNILQIKALSNPVEFVTNKIQSFWSHPAMNNITSPGMRGTTRIQRTVPFGAEWFRP